MRKYLFLLVLAIGSTVNAQIDFLPHYISDISNTVGAVGSSIALDMDGDSDLDIIYSSLYDNQIAWQENIDGAGNFSNLKLIYEGVAQHHTLYGADLNDDGDIDIVATSGEDKVFWFENLGGTSGFTQPKLIADDVNYASSVVAGDMDNDGDMDIVVCSDYESIVWYENLDGLGTFNDGSSIVSNASGELSVFVEDMDADGDLDVIWSTIVDDVYIRIYWIENINNGVNFSAAQTLYNFIPEINYPNHANLGADDMDGDGDIDVVFSTNNEIGWLENIDGQGDFSNQHLIVQSYYRDKHVAIKSADLDGDGDIDVIATTNNFGDPKQLVWFENIDGIGNFGEEIVVHQNIENTNPLLAEDLDGDDKVDLVSGSIGDEALVWFRNADNGADFEAPRYISKLTRSPSHAIVKDLDNDGDSDVLAVMHGAVVWYENFDGEGSLALQEVLIPSIPGGYDLADIDADGDLDIVVGEYGGIRWYENESLSLQ